MINGANLFFPKQFGIQPDPSKHGAGRNEWLLGLVNSAPYVCPFPFPLVRGELTVWYFSVMLRCAGLLADIAAQLLPRQTGNDLRHCDHLLRHMHLAGRYELVAASLCRSFRPRSRNRTQECYRPSFRS